MLQELSIRNFAIIEDLTIRFESGLTILSGETGAGKSILIGGLGERKTLRLVAQYADACNLFATIGVSELRRKLDILKRHCDDVGRAYEEVEKTSLNVTPAQTGVIRPQEIVVACEELADTGIQHAIFGLPSLDELPTVEAFGREVIPEVAFL